MSQLSTLGIVGFEWVPQEWIPWIRLTTTPNMVPSRREKHNSELLLMFSDPGLGMWTRRPKSESCGWVPFQETYRPFYHPVDLTRPKTGALKKPHPLTTQKGHPEKQDHSELLLMPDLSQKIQRPLSFAGAQWGMTEIGCWE